MFNPDTFGRILRDPDPAGAAGQQAGGNGGAAGADGGGSGSGVSTTWIDSLPEEVKTNIPQEYVKDPNVTKYKDLPEFLKGHVNQSKLIGAKGIIVPKEDASPEEQEKFLNALGRPEKPEGYKLTQVQNLHQSIKVTPETQGAFHTQAHKLGLTNKQADGLNQWYLNALNQMTVNQEKVDLDAVQKAETALRSEWGEKFDNNRANVVKLLTKVGGEELINSMGGANGLGNNPVVLKALGKIASMVSEDQMNLFDKGGNSVDGVSGNETKEQAMKKIVDINNADQKTHPYWNDRDPKHDEAVKERQRLYNIVYGGGGE